MRIFHNVWLKILALMIAFVFWYVLVPHENLDISEENFLIPVKVINVPSAMVIMGDLPDTIQVRLRGAKKLLESFRERDRGFTIDMKNDRPGKQTVPVLESRLGIPEQLQTISIIPVNIEINLESRMQKLLPVTVQVSAHPPRGFTWDITTIPDNALVQGPKSVIDTLNTVATIPVEPDPETMSYQGDLLLTPPHSLVRIIQPTQVSVTFQTKPIETKRSTGRKNR